VEPSILLEQHLIAIIFFQTIHDEFLHD
jgi:hypothetical protein